MSADRVLMFVSIGAHGLRVTDRIFHLEGSRRVFNDAGWAAMQKRVQS